MQTADFERFRAVMVGIGKVYEREIDGPLLDAYWLSLRGWSLDDFESAAGNLMATSKFMPRPAEFTALRKAGRPTAGEAWAAALSHGSGGWRERRSCGDDLVDRVANMIGGYRSIAMCEDEKLGFLERRFCEHYESLQDAEDVRGALPAIANGHPRLDGVRHAIECLSDFGNDDGTP